MYYNEFIKALEDMPTVARVIRWRKRGQHLYHSAVLVPISVNDVGVALKIQYKIFFVCKDSVESLDDIYIIGSWPIEDCVKIMSVLYTYNDEIIGEV